MRACAHTTIRRSVPCGNERIKVRERWCAEEWGVCENAVVTEVVKALTAETREALWVDKTLIIQNQHTSGVWAYNTVKPGPYAIPAPMPHCVSSHAAGDQVDGLPQRRYGILRTDADNHPKVSTNKYGQGEREERYAAHEMLAVCAPRG